MSCFKAITADALDMIALLSWLIAAPAILALSIFLAETLFGIARLNIRSFSGEHPPTTILIPAHNEALIIEETIDRLRPLLSADVRLLVVADNCSDTTAQLVRKAGQAVVERTDSERRGKGFALAFGRSHLEVDPPECVIVFDADCQTDAASIAALAKFCVTGKQVAQARYIFEPDLSVSAKVQISNFAFWVKNVVRQRGAHRLGGAAILVGTGMAFPWRIFRSAPLATANIVEDLALGIYLTQNGSAPTFLEQASVVSSAAGETATLEQRARWEHGFLAMAKSHGLCAIASSLRTRNRKSFLLGLHLLVPPLAFLLLFAVASLAILAVLMWVTGHGLAFATLAFVVAAATGSIFLNWLVEGRQWLSFAAMLRLPLYLIWKLPVYRRFARGETAEWTRTERSGIDGERHPHD